MILNSYQKINNRTVRPTALICLKVLLFLVLFPQITWVTIFIKMLVL